MHLLRLRPLNRSLNLHRKWPSLSFLKSPPQNSLVIATLHHQNFSSSPIPIKSSTLNGELQPGAILNNFEVKSIESVPDLYLTAIKLQHLRTGSPYLHIAREDPNNVFCVGFRTTPMDSTGVSHILEHTTLCGSAKYPCRDPFFKMLNRSLSTFMNAMTGPDYTIYPFASQNAKDFYNLMGVYLDAVLHPRLRELDFLQEGWRLEHQDPLDPTTPLVFKGVVFNEMKGAFSDSQQILGQKLLNSLLPSHTYGHVSGGEPLKILDLTWRQLKDFHAKHYHPSNAKFFTYGNLPLANHLEFIDGYISKFERIPPSEEVPLEPKWPTPKQEEIHCRVDPFAPDPSKQTTAVVSYALTDIQENYETFVAQILAELLLSGPNAPFYPTLLEPNIGMGLSPVSGFDAHTRDTTFSVGLQGIHDDDVSKVFGLIDDTFRHVVVQGFDQQRIEGILHGVELNVRHQSANFGLNLAMGITPLWNHNGDPVRALQIQEKVKRFRQDLANDPQFLNKLVQKYFVDNTHKLSLVMRPNEKYEDIEKQKEAAILSDKIAKLTEEDKKSIYEKGLQLKELQSTTEDISCLPTLQISDIPAQVEHVELHHQMVRNIPLQLCPQPTNGMTYFRTILNTQHVPAHLKPFLPLFCSVLTKMGAGKLDYKQFDQEVELKTGGLGVGLHIRDDQTALNKFEEGIYLSSYCLDRNLPQMFDLWTKIFNELDLSNEGRFETLVRHLVGDMINGITHIGHQFAMSLAASGLTPAARFKEELEGLTFVKQLRDLTEAGQFFIILENLRQIAQHVLRPQHMRMALNLGPETTNNAIKALESFVCTIPAEIKSSDQPLHEISNFEPSSCKIHHVLPVPVNFTSRTYQTVPFASSDFAPLRVLARLMSAKYLHPEIREKGGAYGGGANAAANGIFSFYSYRDPRSLATLDSFSGAIKWALDAKYEDESIKEAKLSVFQKIDAPTPPGSKGLTYFLNRITEEELNAHRDNVKKVKRDDLVRVTSRYLQNAAITGNVILGPTNTDISNDKSWRIQ